MQKFRTISIAVSMAMVAGIASAEELRFGVKVETPSIDPHWSTNTSAIGAGRQAFDMLIGKDHRMALQPELAVSWKALDDLTWEFKLRKGVKFHDGTPFTADDAIYSIERHEIIKSPASFIQYTAGKTPVKIDDHTIQIKTEVPTPLMETDMAAFAIVSKKHAEGAEAPVDFNLGKATIGTGPYKFIEWRREDSLVYEANPDWWGGKPKWDRVVYKPLKSDPTRVATLKSGDVDIIDEVPTTDLASLAKDPDVVINQGQGNRPFFIWFDSRRDLTPYVWNNDGTPAWPNPLRDWKVRKALSLAINRQAIVDRVFNGAAFIATQFLPEGFYGYNDTLMPEPYDPALAKQLLAEAGFPDGFKVALHGATGGYLNDAKVAETITQFWTQVGVKTDLRLMPKQIYYSKHTKPMNYSLGIRSHSIASGEPSVQLKVQVHTNPVPESRFRSWPSGSSNPRTDALIEEALVTVDSAKREKLFAEAIGIAVRDVAIAPIYFGTNTWATRKGLKYRTRLDGFNMAEEVSRTN